jgi:hypothetical protein
MNHIFWQNKGHTRKLELDNIWPTAQICDTPIQFLEDKELVLIINPKKLESNYFMATFWCFDATSAKFEDYENYRGELISTCHFTRDFFWADYVRKGLDITTTTFVAEEYRDTRAYFGKLYVALQLLENAVQLFDATFPLQQYVIPQHNAVLNNT